MVFEELKYLQKLGVTVKIAIADAEAYAVRRLDRKKTIEYGLEYIAHAIAWGLDPEKTTFYFQTSQSREYYRLIQLFSRKISMAEMEAIYGELSPAKIMAALTQAADILHPQLEAYGGYKYVIVPVGADQDPHIRLARDIADRFEHELGLIRPSSMYHKFITGLDGNKMSSSRPDYAIFLLDDPSIVRKKIMMALTGGRATAEEQRRLGGEPHKCSVYQLYMYFVEDDDILYNVYNSCISGKILCGECKRRIADIMVDLIREHQKRYSEVLESGLLDKVVEKPSF
jgi:tryptophanyl-tRNA synthetase